MVQNTIGYPWASRREGLISPLAVAMGLWGGMSLQAWQVVPVISHSADTLQGIVPWAGAGSASCRGAALLPANTSGCFIDPVNKKGGGGKIPTLCKGLFSPPLLFGSLPLFKFKQICYPNICSLII